MLMNLYVHSHLHVPNVHTLVYMHMHNVQMLMAYNKVVPQSIN